MSGNRTADIGNLLENYGQKQVLLELESLVNQYKRHDSLNPGIYTCEVIAGVTGIYCPVSFMLDARMAVVAMLGIMCIVSLCKYLPYVPLRIADCPSLRYRRESSHWHRSWMTRH